MIDFKKLTIAFLLFGFIKKLLIYVIINKYH